MVPEIAFFITGLQDAAILHHDADPAGKMECPEQALNGCGKNFGGAHLAAKLDEFFLFIDLSCVHDDDLFLIH